MAQMFLLVVIFQNFVSNILFLSICWCNCLTGTMILLLSLLTLEIQMVWGGALLADPQIVMAQWREVGSKTSHRIENDLCNSKQISSWYVSTNLLFFKIYEHRLDREMQHLFNNYSWLCQRGNLIFSLCKVSQMEKSFIYDFLLKW